MAAASKRAVVVVAALVTAVAVALILLVGSMRKEDVPQGRSAGGEETSLLEDRRERQTRQLTQYEQLRYRFCTQRGFTVMEDTECDQKNRCEGTYAYCLLRKCCCRTELCNCLRAVCRAIPEAEKYCENEGKCTLDCRVKFFYKGFDITHLCEKFTREQVEAELALGPCRESCPFRDKPCSVIFCAGAPQATCEDRCNGECDAKYFLDGVDITDYCYLHFVYIESYVAYIKQLQGITDGSIDTEEGDQGDNSGSGSGSDSIIRT